MDFIILKVFIILLSTNIYNKPFYADVKYLYCATYISFEKLFKSFFFAKILLYLISKCSSVMPPCANPLISVRIFRSSMRKNISSDEGKIKLLLLRTILPRMCFVDPVSYTHLTLPTKA